MFLDETLSVSRILLLVEKMAATRIWPCQIWLVCGVSVIFQARDLINLVEILGPQKTADPLKVGESQPMNPTMNHT